MRKVLRRQYFSNGYQCSCCRSEWETVEWIDVEDMITNEQIEKMMLQSNGEFEGEYYEWDGETIGGFGKHF